MNRNDLEYENHFAGLDFGSYLIEKQEAADPENTFTPLACDFFKQHYQLWNINQTDNKR